MITLKTFDKMDVNTQTEYSVFDSNDCFIEHFKLDYLDKDDRNREYAIHRKNELIAKNAKVEMVSVNSANGFLSVTLKLN